MTTTASLVLAPLDTLFFRDGRPFDVDDEGLVEAASLFPPYPSMVAGAIRAAFGRRGGWSGSGRWSDPALKDWLGDGDDLKRMRYRGPFLLQGSGGHGRFELRLPCPAALLGRRPDEAEQASRDFGAYAEVRLLSPSQRRMVRSDCDDGAPAAELAGDRTEEFESLSGHWISVPLMREVLAGGPFGRLPDIVGPSDVFRREKRLGLARLFESHAAIDGQLYATAKVRLREDFALGAIVESKGTDDLSLSGVLPLGGESRAVGVETLTDVDLEREIASTLPPVDAFAAQGPTVRYTAVLITPAKVSARGGVDGLPGRIVAAAHDRAAAVGMWSVDAPGKMSLFYPAGTTWFLEIEGRDGAAVHAELEAARRTGLGAQAGLGFGEFVYGLWPQAV